MTVPRIRAELAAATRAVNAAFACLPRSAQESIEIVPDGLEAEIDASLLVGDQERARGAIRAWRECWLERFKESS